MLGGNLDIIWAQAVRDRALESVLVPVDDDAGPLLRSVLVDLATVSRDSVALSALRGSCWQRAQVSVERGEGQMVLSLTLPTGLASLWSAARRAPRPSVKDEPPTRVVDDDGVTWTACPHADSVVFQPNSRARKHGGLPGALDFGELLGQRWPYRVVEPVAPHEDHAALVPVLVAAGRRAMASVLVALGKLVLLCVERERIRTCGTFSPAWRDGTWELTAGRPGSSESEALIAAVWDGGLDIADSRTDPSAVSAVYATLYRWITGPTYIEVAENLLHVVGAVIDERGGWDLVADQWLRGKSVAPGQDRMAASVRAARLRDLFASAATNP
ncbi:hypothetical protein GCM10010174_03130 [Kutzneria viridogrisea]|uniref:Uncharacterized protein n=1 Tax=Kutzneria viridogrisea TaxID=47990 RepID=A0ABR6BR73_9PSEU|nr:hypothetical protein [Kutzneria viridogrisea]